MSARGSSAFRRDGAASRLTTYTPPAHMNALAQAVNQTSFQGVRAPGISGANRLGELHHVARAAAMESSAHNVHGAAMEIMTRHGIRDAAHSAYAAGVTGSEQQRRHRSHDRAGPTTREEAFDTVDDVVDGSIDVVHGDGPVGKETEFNVDIPGRPHQEWDEMLRPEKPSHESVMSAKFNREVASSPIARAHLLDFEPSQYERPSPITERKTASPPSRRKKKTPEAGVGQGNLF